MHRSGHFLIANSVALATAGIGPTTPSPPGGTIERDTHGNPTGLLSELSAIELVTRHIPAPSADELEHALLWAQARFNEEGVTSVKETYPAREYADVASAYRGLHRRRALSIRPTLLRQVSAVEDARMALREISFDREPVEGVRERGIKVFLDGSLVARTAWLNIPYDVTHDHEPDWAGSPSFDVRELDAVVELAIKADCDIAIHAIGDRAVDVAVASYAAHRQPPDTVAVRSVVHALMLSVPTSRLARRAGLTVETQPVFLSTLGAGYRNALGGERLAALIPMQTMLRAGLTVGAGSDAPTGPVGPRHGMWAACVRPSPSKDEPDIFAPTERVRPDQALATYLHFAALCLGSPGRIGTLAVGAWCDLVAWEDNLLHAEPDDIARIRPVLTVVGGRVVWAHA
jgi:predicted amidohydrolase YtcJ